MTLIDLLLPATDAGVLAQLVLAALVGVWAIWKFWRVPEWRLVAIGATLVALGLIGVRALH